MPELCLNCFKRVDRLVEDLKKLLADKQVKDLVSKRINEFKELGKGSCEALFKELCFCILTANYNAEKGIKIQKVIGDGFLNMKYEELAKKLRVLGHRFPETRARYIVGAREYAKSLRDILAQFGSEEKAREWLVKNIKGIGYKEASHFLRNIGCFNLSILDIHIINLLEHYGIVKRPKSLTKKKYLEIENILREIAKRLNLTLGELDLYLWYMGTGKVLK